MTSRKSFQNNFGYAYRTGLRDNALFPALNAAAMLLFFLVVPFMSIFYDNMTQDDSGKMVAVDFSKQYAFVFSTDLEFSRYVVLGVLLIAGVLTGITAFRFITGKKTINVYYSLGITRAKLFAAKYLSGLTLLFASVLIPMLASLVMNMVYIGVNKYMLIACLFETLGMFSITVFAYSLTAAVFSTVGTMFEGALFSSILLFFPEIFFTCLDYLIRKLVIGTPLGFDFGSWSAEELVDSFEAYNPLRYFSEGMYVYSMANAKHELPSYDTDGLMAWAAPSFLRPVLWLLFTAAIFGLGVLLYKRRKAEIGGFIGTNKVLNFIGIFIIGFFGFSVAYYALESRGMALAVAVGAAVLCVIYAVLSLLLLRNFKQFLKDAVALPIQLAITALLFVFFATGYFGAANRIPKTEDISYAQISAIYTDSTYTEKLGWGGYYYSNGLFSANTVPFGKYESEKDIAFIRGIHEKLVEAGRTEPNLLADDYNGTRAVAVQMVYVLKNGKEVRRSYYGVDDAVLAELARLSETDYYKASLEKLFKSELKTVEEPKRDDYGNVISGDYSTYMEYLYVHALREGNQIRLYNKSLSAVEDLTLTDAQRKTLLDCLYKDLSALTPENRYSGNNVLGVLTFANADDNNYGEFYYDEEVYYEDEEDYEEGFPGINLCEWNNPFFFVTTDMTATVQFLKETGCYDVVFEKPTVQKVWIEKIAYNYSSHAPWMIEYRRNTAYEFLAGSDLHFDLYGDYGMVTNSDAAVIKGLYDAAVPRAVAQPQDYMVTFITSDFATCMYVPADKMPDDLKK